MVKLFIKSCLRESSIHGLPYLIKPTSHWLEKVFWFVVTATSVCFTFDICWDQWDRYRNSPTVLAIENNYQSWTYDPIGVTVCSNYVNTDIMGSLINRTWGIEDGPKVEYYRDFLYTLSQLRYNNLSSLSAFQNDSTIRNQDLLQLTREIRSNKRSMMHGYKTVMTEMGVCYTTSSLYEYQTMSGVRNHRRHFQNKDVSKCRAMDECKSSVTPLASDGDHIFIFLHNNKDIMSPEDAVRTDILGKSTIDITINVQEIVASDKLRDLSPESRQCLFYDEPNSVYFKVYAPTLCRIQCRIENALRLCGCRPFFYMLGPGKVCDIDGMICLSLKEWFNTTCICPDLCSSINYYKSYQNVLEYGIFERMLTITLNFPKSRIKRRIVFSVDQLIVAFGGAAALFLGFSFLSGTELVFFFFEYIVDKFRSNKA